jgi:hypothetical protein
VCRAAIITEVPEYPEFHEDVSLAAINPTGMFFNENVRHDEIGKAGGTWHWPERM